MLPEVAVADADPATLAIYRSIMRHSGTGTPALIIRHFAVFPGFLEWVWRAVGDEVATGQVLLHALDAVDRTPAVTITRIDQEDLSAAGVNASGCELLANIVANYNRMNPMNYSLIRAVRNLLGGSHVPSGNVPILGEPRAAMPPPCAPLPAPIAVDDMPEDVRQAVLQLSEAIPRSGAPVVPTLYRHLAIWPDLMRLLAPRLAAVIESGTVADRMAETEHRLAPLVDHVLAKAHQRELRPPPLPDTHAMVRTLDTFRVAIPHMTVIGRAIEAAIPSLRTTA